LNIFSNLGVFLMEEEKKGKRRKSAKVNVEQKEEIRQIENSSYQKEQSLSVQEREQKNKQKFLVTGACGFSGSHMVDLLVEEGYDVIATDREDAPRRWLNPEVKFIPSDLLDKRTLDKVVDSVDCIFHPAAIFSYSASLEDLIRVNVIGTKNLLDVAVANGVKKMVMWSTAGVYDVSKLGDEPIDENGPIGPSNNYEYSKLKQEELAMEYHISGKINLTIIRPAPIYGPRNLYGFANIVFGVAKFPVVIVPIIENRAVSVHVKDVCGAALFLSQKDEANGEVFNIVDDSDYSYSDVNILVAQFLGKPYFKIPIKANAKHLSYVSLIAAKFSRLVNKYFPLLFDLPLLGVLKYVEEDTARYIAFSYRFSNKKLKSFGYSLKYPDLKDGLPETIQWYRDYGYL
jgi:nucleoside-diphosphate-sugar epimerase